MQIYDREKKELNIPKSLGNFVQNVGGEGGVTPEEVEQAISEAMENETARTESTYAKPADITAALEGYNPTDNFKTINGNSIIGEGNIEIQGGSGDSNYLIVDSLDEIESPVEGMKAYSKNIQNFTTYKFDFRNDESGNWRGVGHFEGEDSVFTIATLTRDYFVFPGNDEFSAQETDVPTFIGAKQCADEHYFKGHYGFYTCTDVESDTQFVFTIYIPAEMAFVPDNTFLIETGSAQVATYAHCYIYKDNAWEAEQETLVWDEMSDEEKRNAYAYHFLNNLEKFELVLNPNTIGLGGGNGALLPYSIGWDGNGNGVNLDYMRGSTIYTYNWENDRLQKYNERDLGGGSGDSNYLIVNSLDEISNPVEGMKAYVNVQYEQKEAYKVIPHPREEDPSQPWYDDGMARLDRPDYGGFEFRINTEEPENRWRLEFRDWSETPYGYYKFDRWNDLGFWYGVFDGYLYVVPELESDELSVVLGRSEIVTDTASVKVADAKEYIYYEKYGWIELNRIFSSDVNGFAVDENYYNYLMNMPIETIVGNGLFLFYENTLSHLNGVKQNRQYWWFYATENDSSEPRYCIWEIYYNPEDNRHYWHRDWNHKLLRGEHFVSTMQKGSIGGGWYAYSYTGADNSEEYMGDCLVHTFDNPLYLKFRLNYQNKGWARVRWDLYDENNDSIWGGKIYEWDDPKQEEYNDRGIYFKFKMMRNGQGHNGYTIYSTVPLTPEDNLAQSISDGIVSFIDSGWTHFDTIPDKLYDSQMGEVVQYSKQDIQDFAKQEIAENGIKIGNTTLNESQLQALLALLS